MGNPYLRCKLRILAKSALSTGVENDAKEEELVCIVGVHGKFIFGLMGVKFGPRGSQVMKKRKILRLSDFWVKTSSKFQIEIIFGNVQSFIDYNASTRAFTRKKQTQE